MRDLNVCIGSSCHLKGSYNVIQTFQQLIEERGLHDKIKLKAVFCLKQCGEGGVAVRFDGNVYHVEPENALLFFNNTILDVK